MTTRSTSVPAAPSPDSGHEHGFPRERRLLSRRMYQPVFDAGRALRGSAFTVLFRPRNLPETLLADGRAHDVSMLASRLGMVIAKKNVRHAVQRNRVKRVIREYFRLHPPAVASDVVILARRAAATRENADLRSELDRHWRNLP